MFVLEKGNLQVEKSMPVSPYAVLKYWLEKLLNMEGPTLLLSQFSMETRRLRMKYLFPLGAIDISVYLKKSILSSFGGVI